MAKLTRGFWLVGLLLLACGCNVRLVSPFATVTPTMPPVLVPPLVTATPAVATVAPTDTPLSTATDVPTLTPAPSTPLPPTPAPPTPIPPTPVPAVPGSLSTYIQFAPGATSAVVLGWARRGDVARYVLRANAGQRMVVAIASPGEDVFLTLIGADGSLLKSYVDRQARWEGVLPVTGDYQLEAVPIGQDTGLTMRVTVYAPIRFSPGGTSATMNSPVQRVSSQGVEIVGGYVLRAAAGQTMDVALASPNGNILLNVYGADGVPLKRYVDGQAAWRGVLPVTQDYVLEAVSVGPDAFLNLTVTIPPVSGPVIQPMPIPIRFAPGDTWATVAGRLSPGASQPYVLRAMSGQRMEVGVWPQGLIGIAVRGANGSEWSAQPWEGGLVIPWLPATQEYVITLTLPASASQAVDYSMRVVIPPL